jgi:putative MATE family efflux protein
MTPDRKMLREIAVLSGPVMIGMISHTVINIVDAAMVGRLGDAPLAAVGLGALLIHILVLVFGSLNVGTQAVTARRVGEGRLEELPGIVWNSAALALAVGITVSLAGYLLSPRLFSLLSREAAILRDGTDYLAIRFLGLFAFVVMFALSGFVYGVARVKIDMTVSIAVNLLNVVLNYFLIYGHWIFPRLEVRGAAIASSASLVAGLVLYVGLVHGRILSRLPSWRAGCALSRSLMIQIVRISAPRAVQSLSILGFLAYLSFIGRIGTSELAVSNIIFRAFDLTFMIGIAIGASSATLVGRSLGAGASGLAGRYGWHAAALGSVVMGTIGLLFLFFPREIMRVFTANEATIELGVLPFRLLGVFQCIDGVGIILSRTLQGIGDTLYVMGAEMVCILGLFIPYGYLVIIHLHGSLVAAWLGVCLYIVSFCAAMAWRFAGGRWKRIRV